MQNSIEIKNLVKKFGSFNAVDDITFNVKKGEVFGFLGPNGAGKTTTIRMLCGLLDQTSGEGYVGGLSIKTQGEEIKQNIGYMSQKFSLYEDLTVSENIAFYAGIYQTKKENRRSKQEEIIKRAELFGKESELTSNLSGSIKQHLALGCALIHDPQIVFLDEPTAGVDPISRKKFWSVIKELSARGVTILVTTHYMDEAERCDRIALINSGKIVAIDTPENLKSSGYMKDILLEIETDNVMRGLEILREMTQIIDVSLYGTYLHVVAQNESAKEDIASKLQECGIKVIRIEKITPSLEDVFVFLIEHDKRMNLNV